MKKFYYINKSSRLQKKFIDFMQYIDKVYLTKQGFFILAIIGDAFIIAKDPSHSTRD